MNNSGYNQYKKLQHRKSSWYRGKSIEMEMGSFLILILVSSAVVSLQADSDNYNYECETRTGNFEGDILITDRQIETVISGRDPVVTDVDKWINNVVPYVIDFELLTTDHAKLVREAMNTIETVSTVRFVPRKHEHDFLVVSGEPSGCWSTLGRNRGLNRMNISPQECMTEGAIIHQLMHVLGIGHMTNQQDRDYFLDIVWNNVRPENVKDLLIHEGRVIPNFGIPFDVHSIMNFGPTHFSRNGMETIVPKNRNHTIGQRKELSAKDIRKLNIMYPCGYC